MTSLKESIKLTFKKLTLQTLSFYLSSPIQIISQMTSLKDTNTPSLKDTNTPSSSDLYTKALKLAIEQSPSNQTEIASNQAIIKYFIQQGAEPSTELIFHVIKCRNYEVLNLLCETKYPINYSKVFFEILTHLGDEFYRPYLDYVWIILQKIPPEEFKRHFGNTHKLVMKDNIEYQNRYGEFISHLLDTAANNYRHQIVKYIITHIQVTDSAKISVVFSYMKSHSAEMIEFLNLHTDVFKNPSNHSTLLTHAIYRNDFDMVLEIEELFKDVI